ncbi:hypothetical protein [Helcococcus kunzii]|uniref:hypothetical protein n=1 Tax=Helcococcus kunzii TaxID=40091 RepID=UPI00389F4DAC
MKKLAMILLSLILLVGCSNSKELSKEDYSFKASNISTYFFMVETKISDAIYNLKMKNETNYKKAIDNAKNEYEKLNSKIKELGNAPDELKSLSELIEDTDKSIHKLIDLTENENSSITEIEKEKENYTKLYDELKNEAKFYYDKYK